MMILISGYEVTPFLLNRPLVKIQSSIIAGSIYLPDTSIELKYVKGMFDGKEPTFKTGYSVEIVDDYGFTMFKGKIKAVNTELGKTTLACYSVLADVLQGVLNFNRVEMHPAIILTDLLDSMGIPHRGISRFAQKYPAMIASVACDPEKNVKAYDVISGLVDMMTIDIATEGGVVVGYERGVPLSGYTISNIMSYPTVTDDGTGRQYDGCSIKYVYDADNPLKMGNTQGKTWSPDYSESNTVQLIDTPSATTAGFQRLLKYGKPHTVYQVKVLREHAPLVLGDWYTLQHGLLDGYYRLTGYQTDGGKVFWLDMEAE